MKQMPRETVSGSDYLSYLLRLWQESEEAVEKGDEPLWRASLTSPASGERVGFASLEDLVEYLQDRTGTSTSTSGEAGCERG